MAHTEPDKAKYLNLSFIFKFIPEFEKPRSVAVNAPIAYAMRRDFLSLHCHTEFDIAKYLKDII